MQKQREECTREIRMKRKQGTAIELCVDKRVSDGGANEAIRSGYRYVRVCVWIVPLHQIWACCVNGINRLLNITFSSRCICRFFLFLVLFYFLCDRFFFSPSLVFAKNSVQQRMNRFARFSRARARSLSPCHFHGHAIASAENLSQSNQEKYSSCGCDYMTRTQRNTYSTLIVPPMCSANVCIITRHLYHYHVPNVHTF